MIYFIYLFLYTSVFVILFFCGKQIAHQKNIVNIPSVIAIVVASLNEGLRFGRGIDYNYYYLGYKKIENSFEIENEPLFWFLEKGFNAVGLEWQHLVLLMSFLLIISGYVVVFRFFKRYAMCILPLYIVATMFGENIARQTLAFTIVQFGFVFLLTKREKYYFLCCIIGTMFHYGILPIAITYYVVHRYSKRPLCKPYLACILYLVFAVFFNTSFMLNFTQQLNFLSSFLGGKFEHYADDPTHWLAGGSNKEGVLAFISNVMNFSKLVIYVPIVFIGYKIRKLKNRNYLFFYNLFLLGFITLPVCQNIELLIRMNFMIWCYYSIVFAIIIYYTLIKKKSKFAIRKTWGIQNRWIVIVMLLFYIRAFVFVQTLGEDPNHLLYVWDKHGREYLDVYQYYYKLLN